MKVVIVYGRSDCPLSSAAQVLLHKFNVKPVVYDVGLVEKRLEEMQRKSGTSVTPQIFIGDIHVGGFAELASLFSANGTLPTLLLSQ